MIMKKMEKVVVRKVMNSSNIFPTTRMDGVLPYHTPGTLSDHPRTMRSHSQLETHRRQLKMDRKAGTDWCELLESFEIEPMMVKAPM